MSIISYGSKNALFLSRLWNLLVLNLLWVLGSLPIITFGVSTIAAYSVTLRMVEDDDPAVAETFFRAYRANLGQGLLGSLGMLFFTAAVLLDFILFEAIEGHPIFLLILGILSAAMVLIHFFYVFPLIARYKENMYRHLTNSRHIFMRFFIRSLACLCLVVFELWLFLFNGLMMMYVGFFIAPILVISTISAFAMKIFRLLEKESGIPASI